VLSRSAPPQHSPHAPRLLQNAHALQFLHYSAFSAMLLHELHWLVMSPETAEAAG
jgi:hypothetical protein